MSCNEQQYNPEAAPPTPTLSGTSAHGDHRARPLRRTNVSPGVRVLYLVLGAFCSWPMCAETTYSLPVPYKMLGLDGSGYGAVGAYVQGDVYTSLTSVSEQAAKDTWYLDRKWTDVRAAGGFTDNGGAERGFFHYKQANSCRLDSMSARAQCLAYTHGSGRMSVITNNSWTFSTMSPFSTKCAGTAVHIEGRWYIVPRPTVPCRHGDGTPDGPGTPPPAPSTPTCTFSASTDINLGDLQVDELGKATKKISVSCSSAATIKWTVSSISDSSLKIRAMEPGCRFYTQFPYEQSVPSMPEFCFEASGQWGTPGKKWFTAVMTATIL